jgi:hypothetical protein
MTQEQIEEILDESYWDSIGNPKTAEEIYKLHLQDKLDFSRQCFEDGRKQIILMSDYEFHTFTDYLESLKITNNR